MDLPKLSTIKSIETGTYCDQFYFWACFEGIVLENRVPDGTINDFDSKRQSRGDGSTYHHMIQNLEYAEISNLPLTYCKGFMSQNSARKAAFRYTAKFYGP